MRSGRTEQVQQVVCQASGLAIGCFVGLGARRRRSACRIAKLDQHAREMRPIAKDVGLVDRCRPIRLAQLDSRPEDFAFHRDSPRRKRNHLLARTRPHLDRIERVDSGHDAFEMDILTPLAITRQLDSKHSGRAQLGRQMLGKLNLALRGTVCIVHGTRLLWAKPPGRSPRPRGHMNFRSQEAIPYIGFSCLGATP